MANSPPLGLLLAYLGIVGFVVASIDIGTQDVTIFDDFSWEGALNQSEEVEGPGQRYLASFVSWSPYYYVFGGTKSINDPVPLSSMWKLDISEKKWMKEVTHRGPPAVFAHTTFVLPGIPAFYIYGGYVNDEKSRCTSNFLGYDPVTQIWIILPFGPRSICRAASAGISESGALIFGGIVNGNISNELWFYNANNEKWTPQTFSGGPSPRKGHVAVSSSVPTTAGDTGYVPFFVIGGEDARGNLLADVWAYHYSSHVVPEPSSSSSTSSDASSTSSTSSTTSSSTSPDGDGSYSGGYFDGIGNLPTSGHHWTYLGVVPGMQLGSAPTASLVGEYIVIVDGGTVPVEIGKRSCQSSSLFIYNYVAKNWITLNGDDHTPPTGYGSLMVAEYVTLTRWSLPFMTNRVSPPPTHSQSWGVKLLEEDVSAFNLTLLVGGCTATVDANAEIMVWKLKQKSLPWTSISLTSIIITTVVAIILYLLISFGMCACGAGVQALIGFRLYTWWKRRKRRKYLEAMAKEQRMQDDVLRSYGGNLSAMPNSYGFGSSIGGGAATERSSLLIRRSVT